MLRHTITALLVFCVGYAAGRLLRIEGVDAVSWMESLLYLTLFLVGVSVSRELTRLHAPKLFFKSLVKLTASTVIGSVLGGMVASLVAILEGWRPADGYVCTVGSMLLVSLGMGWYTLTGTVLSMYSSTLAFLGFTSNLLRELITFLVYPLLSKRYRVSGISVGGATTMDTTLPVIYRFGGPDVALLAFSHGLVLTLIIPLLLQATISLVGLHGCP